MFLALLDLEFNQNSSNLLRIRVLVSWDCHGFALFLNQGLG